LNTLAIQIIIIELFPNFDIKIKIYTDNEAVKDILKPMLQIGVQDIDIAYHYVKEELQRNNC
jgi:hypothetical protein